MDKKMRTTRILALILALLLAVVLVGCSGSMDSPTPAPMQTGTPTPPPASPEQTSETPIVTDPSPAATDGVIENIAGKYAAENDNEMYFEITTDGKAAISINAMSGYAKYYSDEVLFEAYYGESSVVLTFTLKSDEVTFPSGYHSIEFESIDGNRCDVFRSLNGFTDFGDFIRG